MLFACCFLGWLFLHTCLALLIMGPGPARRIRGARVGPSRRRNAKPDEQASGQSDSGDSSSESSCSSSSSSARSGQVVTAQAAPAPAEPMASTPMHHPRNPRTPPPPALCDDGGVPPPPTPPATPRPTKADAARNESARRPKPTPAPLASQLPSWSVFCKARQCTV